jgi:hypothetical protein
MVLEGGRLLARAPLPFAAVWLSAVMITYANGRPPFVEDIEALTARGAIVLALWLVLWSFLWGGVLTRFAYPRTTGTAAFLAGCRAYAGRILGLTLPGVVIFHILDRYLGPALGTRYLTSTWMAIFAAGFFVDACIKLAKVRTVMEDRHSILFALAAGWRLLAARPLTVLALYGLIGLQWIVLLFFTFQILSDAGPAGFRWPHWFVNQILTTAIVWFDLLTSASLIKLYQAEMVRRRREPDPAVTSSGLSGLNALTAKE